MKLFRSGAAALLLATAMTATAADDFPDDAILQQRIATLFTDNEEYSDSLVQVHNRRGYILLTGQVTSAELKTRASSSLVFIGSAIRRITNELEVVSTIDETTAEADAALTTSIIADLAAMDAALAERVRAPAHKGVVYLMGALTQEEIARVTERVRFVPGIASIRTSFEILPST